MGFKRIVWCVWWRIKGLFLLSALWRWKKTIGIVFGH
jgi:hypothetical protein